MRLHFVSAFSKIILNESCSYIIYDLLVLQRTPYDKLYAMKAAPLITHLPFAKTRKKQRSFGRLAAFSVPFPHLFAVLLADDNDVSAACKGFRGMLVG